MWMREVVVWSTEHRVHAVDVIGDAGRSSPSRPPLESDAHALWLGDVMDALGVQRAAIVGASLGGGLALDLAIRAPDRVGSLVLITPARIADKNTIGWALPLLLLGPWGARKVRERIVGALATAVTDDERRFAAFTDSIFNGMRPRTEGAPAVTDEQLAQLAVPVLVLLGADDVTMDSARIKLRIERHVPTAEVVVFPDTRHYLGDQSATIAAFLRNVHDGVPTASGAQPCVIRVSRGCAGSCRACGW